MLVFFEKEKKQWGRLERADSKVSIWFFIFSFDHVMKGSVRCKCLAAISKIKACEWFSIPWLNVVRARRKLPRPVLCNCLLRESGTQTRHQNYFYKLFCRNGQQSKTRFPFWRSTTVVWSLHSVTSWQCQSFLNSLNSIAVDGFTTILHCVELAIPKNPKMYIYQS